MAPRLLVVGIDGATWRLLRPWVDEGALPTLAGLVRRGASGELQSVPNMHSPAAWTSLVTGMNPGKHGVFFFTERLPGTYHHRPINGGHRVGRSVWRQACDAGFRVGVVNVPMSYPAERLGEGFMVSGMDAPGVQSPEFTYPAALAQEIERHVGRGVLQTGLTAGAVGNDIIRGRFAQAGRTLVRRVRLRTAVCDYLLRTRPVDIFAVVHTETDGAQHFFWRFIDPAHPDYRPREAARFGGVIRDVYRAVDHSVQTLIERHTPDAVLVVSDHGFGPAFGPQGSMQFLQVLLEVLGFAVPARDGLTETHRSEALWRRAVREVRALGPWLLPQSVRTAVRRRLPGVTRAVRSATGYRLDWARSRAYCAGCPGEVFVNLRGRDPDGIVEPGREYEEVRSNLAAVLAACTDAEGRPIVAEIRRREELYRGPYVEKAGDLFVRLVDAAITHVRVDGRLLVMPRRLLGRRRVRSGFHRPEGVFILAGAGVRPATDLTGLHLYDVAPTALYYLGLPVSAAMDGRVIVEAFDPALTAAQPVTVAADREETPAPATPGYTAADTAAVEQRLRDLGYL